jgi:hypothetical protein
MAVFSLPAFEFQLNIVVSLAYSICRHPDVTLESGLLLLLKGQQQKRRLNK